MIRRPPRSTQSRSSAASDVYKRQVPGHSAGHVAYWREADRVLILGDVFNNLNVITGVPGLNDPKPYLMPDTARNRQSAGRLAALEPAVVCFGHGAPLKDTRKYVEVVAGVAQ